jgi:hypothetical protein
VIAGRSCADVVLAEDDGDAAMLLRALHIPFLLVFLLVGCVTPAETPSTYAPQPPGTARLVFYRAFHYYGPTLYLMLSLNDGVIGILPPNAAIYRDVTPGSYTITFSPTRSAPFQFKTVTVAPGDVFFVKIDNLPQRGCTGGRFSSCDISGFTSVIVDPATAAYDLQAVPLLRG